MFKKIIQKLQKKSNQNQQGSVLVVALIVMVVLTASVAALTNLTINQEYSTQIKSETVYEETTGKGLIQAAIREFKIYSEDIRDYRTYDRFEIDKVFDTYGVTVTNMTDELGYESYGKTGDGESRAYLFTYPIGENDSIANSHTLAMEVYISSAGSTVQNMDPFDFSIGTIGDLILSGGYYGEANLYGENIYFGIRSAYTIYNRNGVEVMRATRRGISTYPDFYLDGASSFIQANNDFKYCTGKCWEWNGGTNPYNIMTSEYIDIAGSDLEQGVVASGITINNFFGDFDYDQTLIDFVTTIGPTDSDTINTTITEATFDSIRDLVLANSGEPYIWTPGNGNWGNWGNFWNEWLKWIFPADEPYTNITNLDTFTPLTNEEYLNYGAFYDGDLTINDRLHMYDLDDEALIIAGDLIIDNDYFITMDGKFVVLGDLIFQGATVDVDGAFYVLGETHFNFDKGEGLQERYELNRHGNRVGEYGLTLMAKDNVFFDSMWESDVSADRPEYKLDIFIYTEQSIFVEAVNSRVWVNGVFFSAAKGKVYGVDDTPAPVIDENGDPVNGIIINSYRGYTNTDETLTESTDIFDNGFYFLQVHEEVFREAYVEVPVFDSIVISQEIGLPSIEFSEFFYLEE